MAIDAKTIAGLLAGQPPCSNCGLPALKFMTTLGIGIEAELSAPSIDYFCDDCAPAGAEDRDNAMAMRMGKAYLAELQHAPPPPTEPEPPAAKIPDAQRRLGGDLRRIARATLGLSHHVVTTVPARLSSRLLMLGQRAETGFVVPVLTMAVRLAASIDGGPAPRAATHEQLVEVLAGRRPPGGTS